MQPKNITSNTDHFIKKIEKTGINLSPYDYDFVYSHIPCGILEKVDDDNYYLIEKEIFKEIPENFSLYIQIPFCERSCAYCFYFKTTNFNFNTLKRYVNALLKELNLLSKNVDLSSKKLKAVYIGGGTPSILPISLFELLLKNVSSLIPKNIEFSLELHPESITKKKIEIMKKYGVTRPSFGIQTFSNKILLKTGRTYTKEFCVSKINLLKKYYSNFNIDMIFGLPFQTKKDLLEDIEVIKKVKPPSVTWYQLWINPRKTEYSPLTKRISKKFMFRKKMFIDARFTINEELAKVGYKNWFNDWYILNKNAYPVYEELRIKGQGNFTLGPSSYGYNNGSIWENAKNFSSYYEKLGKNQLPIEFYRRMKPSEVLLRKTMMNLKGLYKIPNEVILKLPEITQKRIEKLIKMKILLRKKNKIFINPDFKTVRDYLVKHILGKEYWKIKKSDESCGIK